MTAPPHTPPSDLSLPWLDHATPSHRTKQIPYASNTNAVQHLYNGDHSWKPTLNASSNWRISSQKPWSVFNVSRIQDELSELDQQASELDFWDNPYTAAAVNRRLENLRRRHQRWQEAASQVQHLAELDLIAQSDHDAALSLAIQQQVESINQQLDQELGRIAFSKPYDHLPAILTIHAGTGGDEAQFWAQTLLEMYPAGLNSNAVQPRP